MLFIDGRKLGTLIPGSRKQKELSADDIGRVAGLYNLFKRLVGQKPSLDLRQLLVSTTFVPTPTP